MAGSVAVVSMANFGNDFSPSTLARAPAWALVTIGKGSTEVGGHQHGHNHACLALFVNARHHAGDRGGHFVSPSHPSDHPSHHLRAPVLPQLSGSMPHVTECHNRACILQALREEGSALLRSRSVSLFARLDVRLHVASLTVLYAGIARARSRALAAPRCPFPLNLLDHQSMATDSTARLSTTNLCRSLIPARLSTTNPFR